MEFFRLCRTVSFYNEESEDILTDFLNEYNDPKTIVTAEVIEEFSISGSVEEYIKGENEEEVKSFVLNAECVVGECFSLYNLKGDLICTEDS